MENRSELQAAFDLAERHMNEKHALRAENERLRAALKATQTYVIDTGGWGPLVEQIADALRSSTN